MILRDSTKKNHQIESSYTS